MDYQIIALDIDGTLTNSRKEIPAPTLDALLGIQEQGCRVVLATGRPTAGCRHLADKLQLGKYGSYLLSFNGGRITDCKSGRIIYQKTLPRDAVPELYAFAQANNVGLMTYTDDCILTGTDIDSYMKLEAKINGLPIQYVPDFTEHVNFDVNKCLMTAEPVVLEAMEARLKEIYGTRLSIYRSEPYFLEIMPQDIDKAHALQILLSDIGLTREQLICCGDGFNDITMIEFAGLGVAMQNAQKRVKSAADYITESNDNNGILRVINKFISRMYPAVRAEA